MRVIIAGAGLSGLLSAYELACAGAQVVVLERQQAGQESSWAGGGILSPLYPWHYAAKINQLSAVSQAHYGEFCAQLQMFTGIDPQYRRSGMLILDPEEWDPGRHWCLESAVTHQTLSPQEVAEQEPGLTLHSAALMMPDVAQLRNPYLLAALRQALALKGVSIIQEAPVQELLWQSGRLIGARAAGQDYYGDAVLIAAGAWSAQLAQLAGLELAIRPVQGQMLLYRVTPGLLRHIVLHQGRYIIPRGDGHVLVGSTMEERGFDKQTTAEALEQLSQFASAHFACLQKEQLVKQWAGLRPGSPDGIPYLGAVADKPGLFLNCGHFRNGVVLGLACAQQVSNQILSLSENKVTPSNYLPIV